MGAFQGCGSLFFLWQVRHSLVQNSFHRLQVRLGHIVFFCGRSNSLGPQTFSTAYRCDFGALCFFWSSDIPWSKTFDGRLQVRLGSIVFLWQVRHSLVQTLSLQVTGATWEHCFFVAGQTSLGPKPFLTDSESS